ncbi:hypothetical protein DACRYDRAFT_116511 [Dacryopinax primogenitus]|uniref:F-box domain-containing protein n=1 Tax=Dacryopinax primogenitus (strain DJM 731) TaxID=1858805 RepID=M5GBE5_DACPD|nr:uncharacterized protein DACRYDRAFT_116511 [Dacryopinax primogenitus]EJU01323.1 hypothetical protein DACRYDRAFT_116511 [Dacryopinax primogenitus]
MHSSDCLIVSEQPPTPEGDEKLRNVARAAERFDRYASFIRHLSLSGAWWLAIPEGHNGSDTHIQHLSSLLAKLTVIASASRFRPLFPNLRTFKLEPKYRTHIEHILPLFSCDLPYLESFSIQIGDASNPADLASLLAILPQIASNLRQISVVGGLSMCSELQPSFAQLIGKLPSLESFEGGPASVSAGVLQKLDHCSHLRRLIIRGGGRFAEDIVSSACLDTPACGNGCTKHLNAIRRLELKARPTTLTNYILERMDSDRLEALTIWISGENGLSIDEDIRRPITAIVGFPGIMELDIRFHGELKGTDASGYWREMQALFAGRRLRNVFLFISIPLEHDLNDGIVESMARAWPELRNFALMWNDDDTPPGPTLRSLVALTTSCPYLETVQLQSIRSPLGQLPPPNVALRPRPLHLRVRKYHVADPENAATFLTMITSSLTVSRISVFSRAYFWLDELEEDGVWREVVSRMHAIRRMNEIPHPSSGRTMEYTDKYLGIINSV